MPKVEEQLPMGAEVLDRRPVDAMSNIVLAYTNRGPDPYVTWAEYVVENGKNHYYWGHYFDREEDARADFEERK